MGILQFFLYQYTEGPYELNAWFFKFVLADTDFYSNSWVEFWVHFSWRNTKPNNDTVLLAVGLKFLFIYLFIREALRKLSLCK